MKLHARARLETRLTIFNIAFASYNHFFRSSLPHQVDAYLADPGTFSTNRVITQAYKDGLKQGMFIQPTALPHFLPNKPELVMYRPLPLQSQETDDSERTLQQRANM